MSSQMASEYSSYQVSMQPSLDYERTRLSYGVSNFNLVLQENFLKHFICFDPSPEISDNNIYKTLATLFLGNRDEEQFIRNLIAQHVESNKLTYGNKFVSEVANDIRNENASSFKSETLLQIISEVLKINIVTWMFHDYENVTIKFSPVTMCNTTPQFNEMLPHIGIVYVNHCCGFILPTKDEAHINDIETTHNVIVNYSLTQPVSLKAKEQNNQIINQVFSFNLQNKIRIETVDAYGLTIRKIYPVTVPLNVFQEPGKWASIFEPYLIKTGAIVCRLSPSDWKRVKPTMRPFKLQQSVWYREQYFETVTGTSDIFKMTTNPNRVKMRVCEAKHRVRNSYNRNTQLNEMIKPSNEILHGINEHSSLVKSYHSELNPDKMTDCQYLTCSIFKDKHISCIKAYEISNGTTGSKFCIRNHNHRLKRANLQMDGGTKLWFSSPESETNKITRLIANELKFRQLDVNYCCNFINHEVWFPDPTFLLKNDVELFIIEQQPGDLVLTAEGALHYGIDLDFNTNIAFNILDNKWFSEYHKNSPCINGKCTSKNSVQQDLIKKYNTLVDDVYESKIPTISGVQLIELLNHHNSDHSVHLLTEERLANSIPEINVLEGSHPIFYPQTELVTRKMNITSSTVSPRTKYKVNYTNKDYFFNNVNAKFQCKLCAYKGSSSGAVREHVRRHTLWKSCSFCSRQFQDKRKLEAHLLKCK